MARQARKVSATGYYHIMLRGINREFLFERDSDKHKFMELVKEQHAEGLFALAAWCLMNNHVHMIVKADMAQLSKAIKIICLKYAAHYNRVHKRTGPLFGDRFRSENIEEDTYLLGALRYVHMNPVKARLVNDVSAYKWSSYLEYLGEATYINLAERAFIQGFFRNMPSFVSFHLQEDTMAYLETKEDEEKQRDELGEAIIESFCKERGITKARQIQAYPEIFEELCRRLVQEARLSLRRTAGLLETTHNRVYQALQGDE